MSVRQRIPSRRIVLSHACAHVAMAFVAIAAITKLADLPEFARALGTWRLVPDLLVGFLSVAVPAVELILSGLWFAGLHRGGARCGAIVAIAVWTMAYVVEAVAFGPPECGCIGKMLAWQETHSGMWIVIVRNIVLLALPLLGSSKCLNAPLARSGRSLTMDTRRNAGFTLLEILLVIALVALLVSLTIPSLAKISLRSRETHMLSDLRSHTTVVGAYANDFRDFFPCIADPEATHFVVDDGDQRVLFPYFGMRIAWWTGLAESYYGRSGPSQIFYSRPLGSGFARPYYYSDSCVARPEFWRPETRSQNGQIGGTRVAEVVFPSNKSVYCGFPYLGGQGASLEQSRRSTAFVGLADGSAMSLAASMMIAGVKTGDGPESWPRSFAWTPEPGLFTLDGVRGRDLP